MGKNLVEANFYCGRKIILRKQVWLLLIGLISLLGVVFIYQTLFRAALIAEINYLHSMSSAKQDISEQNIDQWVSINKSKLWQLKARQQELQKFHDDFLRFVQTDNHLVLQDFKYDKRVSLVAVADGFAGLQNAGAYFATAELFGGCKITAATKLLNNQYKVTVECG
jgi:hypothetical protein